MITFRKAKSDPVIQNLIQSRVSLVGRQATLNSSDALKQLNILTGFWDHPLRVIADNRGLTFRPNGELERVVDRILTVKDLVNGQSTFVREDSVTLSRDLRDLEAQIRVHSNHPKTKTSIPDAVLVDIIRSDENYRLSLKASGLSSKEIEQMANENMQRLCKLVAQNY